MIGDETTPRLYGNTLGHRRAGAMGVPDIPCMMHPPGVENPPRGLIPINTRIPRLVTRYGVTSLELLRHGWRCPECEYWATLPKVTDQIEALGEALEEAEWWDTCRHAAAGSATDGMIACAQCENSYVSCRRCFCDHRLRCHPETFRQQCFHPDCDELAYEPRLQPIARFPRKAWRCESPDASGHFGLGAWVFAGALNLPLRCYEHMFPPVSGC